MINYDRLKKLYVDGFGEDSKSFIDYFFSEHIQDEHNVLSHCEDGKILSVGYIIEKPAYLFKKQTIFPYLSALSTDTAYRGTGKMKNIMYKAFDTLYERGHSFFGLLPFNYLYYKRFSLNDISFCKSKSIKGGTDFAMREAGANDYEVISKIYDQYSKGFDNKLILTKEAYSKKLLEFTSDDIKLNIMSDKGHDFAFVFADLDNKNIDYYACTDMKLFSSMQSFAGFTYFDFSFTHSPYLQGRIINAKKALVEYPYDKSLSTKLSIQVHDQDIPCNNFCAVLDIDSGQATLKNITTINNNANLKLAFDISILTQNMFCGGQGVFANQKNLFSDKF